MAEIKVNLRYLQVPQKHRSRTFIISILCRISEEDQFVLHAFLTLCEICMYFH
jgi:hypothetical protein